MPSQTVLRVVYLVTSREFALHSEMVFFEHVVVELDFRGKGKIAGLAWELATVVVAIVVIVAVLESTVGIGIRVAVTGLGFGTAVRIDCHGTVIALVLVVVLVAPVV